MNCTYCKKPVVLPGITERAKQAGQTPAEYAKRFPYHADCMLAERDKPRPAPKTNNPMFQNADALMRRQRLLGTAGYTPEEAARVDAIPYDQLP